MCVCLLSLSNLSQASLRVTSEQSKSSKQSLLGRMSPNLSEYQPVTQGLQRVPIMSINVCCDVIKEIATMIGSVIQVMLDFNA